MRITNEQSEEFQRLLVPCTFKALSERGRWYIFPTAKLEELYIAVPGPQVIWVPRKQDLPVWEHSWSPQR